MDVIEGKVNSVSPSIKTVNIEYDAPVIVKIYSNGYCEQTFRYSLDIATGFSTLASHVGTRISLLWNSMTLQRCQPSIKGDLTLPLKILRGFQMRGHNIIHCTFGSGAPMTATFTVLSGVQNGRQLYKIQNSGVIEPNTDFVFFNVGNPRNETDDTIRSSTLKEIEITFSGYYK